MELSKIGRQRSNSLSAFVDKRNCSAKEENNAFLGDVLKKQISIVKDLKGKLEKKDKENIGLASQNEILTQQLEEFRRMNDIGILNRSRNENNELIWELMESFKQLNLQSNKPEIQKVEKPSEFYKFVNNRLYHYEKIENSDAYERFPTPTTVDAAVDNFNDIAEIRYANDVRYNELMNPKVILSRNQDNSCYIIISINKTKYTVFYGVNGRNIELGEKSFSVYEISDVVKSFTDNILRLIYVDISGLYFVPSKENSVRDIINTYQKENKFNFKGPVLSVSVLDGSIIYDGQPITEKNFFDNWIENIKNQGFGIEKEINIILSSIRPKPIEILRNFYPPGGCYKEIFAATCCDNKYKFDWLNAYGSPNNKVNLEGKIWLNFFLNKYISILKSKSKIGCQELVKDGTFSSILSIYNDKYIIDHLSRKSINDIGYNQNVYNAIKGVLTKESTANYESVWCISSMVSKNMYLFKDPEFVKKLKPSFEKVSKEYEDYKKSDKWLPFEIVKNI